MTQGIKLSKYMEYRIICLYKENRTQMDVAKLCGVSKNAVQCVLRRNKVKIRCRRPKGPQTSEEVWERARRLRNGETLEKL